MKIGESLKKKAGKQSNARNLYKKYRERISEEDTFLWL